MKFRIFILFALLSDFSSNPQDRLTPDLLSKFEWTNGNFDDCIRYYRFRTDGYYEHWNCSMEKLDTGRYEVIMDTLKMYEYHLKSQVPIHLGGEEGTEIRFQYNYIFKDNALWSTYYKDYKYNYETFERDPERQYKKKEISKN